jgi:hypothetical protein
VFEWILVAPLLSCGSPPRAEPSPSRPRAPAEAATPSEAESPPVARDSPAAARAAAAPPPEALPQLPIVDLLRSVATDVAVSSVYRNEAAQAARIADGDLETAWNSRTGDLVGAWIEARLPAEATVTSIELTVGFTRRTASADLFAGNHRIRLVRLLRDGAEVGVFLLDPESRALQTLAVTGPGGVYRIEVVEVQPGTRPTWRELCVSEIRIMGRSAGARPGERLPRFAAGRLPDPRPAAGSQDREEVAKTHRAHLTWIKAAWSQLERDANDLDMNTGEPEGTPEERASLERQRRAVLSKAADFVALVDDAASDGLRRAAATSVNWSVFRDRREALLADVARIADAFATVTRWLGDGESQCLWAQTHARLRFVRIHLRAKAAEMFALMDDDPRTDQYAFVRDLMERMQVTSAVVAERLRRRRMPAGLDAQADWEAMLAQVDAAEAACGWSGASGSQDAEGG